MAKDLTKKRTGIFLEKGYFNTNDPNTIRFIHAYSMLDDDSPDGVSFVYDDFDILPDGTIGYCDGGCYWGYDNVYEMLDHECGISTATEVFEDDIYNMWSFMKFDYEKLNRVLSEAKENIYG